MKKLSFWRVATVALVLFGALQFAQAADVNGRIRGTVMDPQGAALAGIHVTAVNEQTGVKFETTSGADGGYLFPQLPVGTYTVSVTASGFKSFTAKGIVIQIDHEYVEPVKLAVGSTTEVVEVSGSAIQVNTTDMQLNNTVNSQQMVELPLIGRNFAGLELTLPGVQAPSDRFGNNYSVSGAQTQQSEYLINGADTNDISLNTIALSPNLDAIDQFNLIDGPMNAEYDRNSGGIVSATIKQGTNSFHGDAFEFYRDTFLNTLSFYQKSFVTGKGTVSPYHQHIFGGTVGGPIFHDRLFFFGAYQGTRQRVPQGGGQVSVYSGANVAGNFSVEDNGSASAARPSATQSWGSWMPNVIPSSLHVTGCTTAGETWAQCAYDLKGQFNPADFNSIAKSLTSKYVPAPNGGGYTYLFNPVTLTKENQYIGRLDYALNPANQFTGLAIYDNRPVTDTLPFTGATLPGFGDKSTLTVQQYTFDFVHQFSSTMVNDLAMHYTRFNYQAVEPQQVVDPASLGFNIKPENTAGMSVPTISVSGTQTGFTLGFSTNGPQPRIDQVAQIDETVSKVFGRHTLKFGYDGRRFNVSNPFSAQNNGSFSFANTGAYSSGDGALDFLMGNPASYGQNSGAAIIADAFLNYVFAQDSWKLTPTLSVDYGIGYSIDTPLHNNQYGGEGIACIIPGEQSKIFSGAPTGMVYPGDPGCYNSGQAYTRYGEFGPRLGFAWAPDLGMISGTPGKFSIRGGFGVYYNRSEEETALQTLATPPFGTSTTGATNLGAPEFANPFVDINGGGSVANPFPYTFPKKGDNIDFSAFEPIYFISTFGKDFRAPYSENFQLSVEREFPSRVVARLSYVGSLGRHNQTTTDANPITPAGHAACLADPTCIANRNLQSYFYPSHTLLNNPNLLDVGSVDSGSASSYHSLQANITKAMTHNLTFQLSYTWAHAMDTGSSFENAGFGENSARGYNQFDPSLNIGDSAFDVRHRLVFAPIYVTPSIAGHSPYSPINLALSGWEISGITTLATGQPFDVSYAGGSSRSLWCPYYTNYYACPDAPNMAGPILKTGNLRFRDPAHSGRSPYISTLDFSPEPIGQFGNTRRNPAHGPGLNNTNMILAKNFNMNADGTIRLQLRMESDNVFNHTQFTNPATTWNDAYYGQTKYNFGYVSGTQAARQSQLAAKIYF